MEAQRRQARPVEEAEKEGEKRLFPEDVCNPYRHEKKRDDSRRIEIALRVKKEVPEVSELIGSEMNAF
jgi:hypothetical protein